MAWVSLSLDSSPGGRDVADHSEHRLRFNGLGGRDTGEPNDELAPAPGPFTECFDPATVQLHQPAHQRESHTEPPLRALEPALTLYGQVEQVREQIGWDADPGVRDADHCLILLAADANADRATGRSVLDRVREEICDDLVQSREVDIHPDRLGANVDHVTFEPSRARQVAHRPLDAGGEVQRLAGQDDVPAGDVGDVEEIV